MKELTKNQKQIIIIAVAIVAVIIVGIVMAIIINNKSNEETAIDSYKSTGDTSIKEEKVDIPKLNIINLNSVTRPFAIVVNNTPVAVKVQQGLNKAFMVYEFPTEGGTSRLMALFKDVEDAQIGTIRSSRLYFPDMALESDAIYVAYGWNHYSQDDLTTSSINYIQGIVEGGNAFWRENPEGLALEHTMYTSIAKLRDFAETKGYNLNSSKAINTHALNYVAENTTITSLAESEEKPSIEKDDIQAANKVTIVYGGYGNVTSFEYDEPTKTYNRFEAGNPVLDHETGEQFDCKNIIIQEVRYRDTDDNKYIDVELISSGTGWYVTNGEVVPIRWSKQNRRSKTVYKYEDGTEVKVNDGRTYVEIHPSDKDVTFE